MVRGEVVMGRGVVVVVVVVVVHALGNDCRSSVTICASSGLAMPCSIYLFGLKLCFIKIMFAYDVWIETMFDVWIEIMFYDVWIEILSALDACVYVCVHLCVCVCVCVCVFVHIHMYVYVYMCIHVQIYIYIYI